MYKTMNDAQFKIEGTALYMHANAYSDFISSAVSKTKTHNAAFVYKEIDGDFTIKAKVSHNFIGRYDACGFMAYDNEDLWAKTAFELTNFGTHTVVSVITNKLSDDANGVNLEGNEVWLQLARKDDAFAIHYGLKEDELFKVRVFSLPMQKKIKVGFLTQSPFDEGKEMKFDDFTFVEKAPENIRTGF